MLPLFGGGCHQYPPWYKACIEAGQPEFNKIMVTRSRHTLIKTKFNTLHPCYNAVIGRRSPYAL